jgi:hypothetical protein
MRKLTSVISRTTSVLAAATLAMATLGFVGDASAGTIKLNGNYNVGTVGTDCVNAGGDTTKGMGPGGYGCKTPKGEVSCTAKGVCTGTCQACGAQTGGSTTNIKSVLQSSHSAKSSPGLKSSPGSK